jgi:glycosyltransferase involved in cell wall biosynthesis
VRQNSPPTKIRVLEVLATLRRAGAERVAVALACGLDRTRFETEVVSLFDAFPGGFEPVLAECGVNVRHLGKHAGLDLRIYPRLRAAIRAFRPAVVHTHSYVLRYAFPAAFGAKMVHTVHNVARREVEAAGRCLHRVAFRCGVQPVAVAEEVAHTFREEYGFAPETIPNGVDVERFRPSPETRLRWRRSNGFTEDEVLVASVARLEPQKNPVGAIDAFAATPRGRLLMVGDGTLRAAAEKRAVERGVAERVRFLGIRADIPELLAAADVFLLASHWEGNPMAAMEAMAAGLPVVATPVGGLPGVLGQAGVLVPAGALGGALAALVSDPAQRTRLGAAARKAALGFSEQAMVAAYAALFERLA